MKKMLVLLLVVSMVLGMTACGSSSKGQAGEVAGKEQTKAEETEKTQEITFPLEEEVTLTVWMPFANTIIESMEDNEVVGLIREKTGVNLNFIHTAHGRGGNSASAFTCL